MNLDDAFRKLMNKPETDKKESESRAVSVEEENDTQNSEESIEAEEESAVEQEISFPPIDFSKLNIKEKLNYSPVEDRSQVAEEYRILRTRLQIINPSRNSVMFTSCRHGEGKSSTSMNLSLFLAKKKDKKILLIDLDLRRSRIAKMFNLKPEIDIVDVVRERNDVEEAIIYSKKENLYIMPVKRDYSNATEILESNKMREIIEQAHENFDFVIIDTCPCLSTADPTIIGRMVGGAVMVVRSRQTQRESLEHAVLALQEHGIPTLGLVITFMKYFIPRYFYRYQYYHDTYYYYHYYAGKDSVDG
ncbi:MAG: CpsD/CapB family tyrosine-protein kinase [Planctomycetota bacterium]|jgi:capsular exopolysaccharide synthesis family protein